jgi:hypothetical protein
MSAGANNVATADNYSNTVNAVEQGNTVQVNLQVFNAAVYIQFRDPLTFNWDTSNETLYAPGLYSLKRRCSGARVRSGLAGTPGRVTLELLTPADLGG